MHLKSLIGPCLLAWASAAASPMESDPQQPATLLWAANGTAMNRIQLDAFVDHQMRELQIPGLALAVIGDGRILYTAARGVANLDSGEPLTPESVFEVASLSKPVFAWLVLQQVAAGLIDLDVPLHQYQALPELADDPRHLRITTRMALSHQSGLPNWRWFDPSPDLPRGTLYLKSEPGHFGYSGEGYQWLAQAVAAVRGKDLLTLDEVFQANVVASLGLSCASFVRSPCVAAHKVSGHREGRVSDDGWPRSFPDDTPQTFGAAGRLHTTVKDYARFMLALMAGTGLPQELVDQLYAAQTQLPPGDRTRELTGATAWGLGLAIEPTPYGTRYEHGGNNGDFQSGMMFYRDLGIGYVFFTNSDRGQELNPRLEALLDQGAPPNVVTSNSDPLGSTERRPIGHRGSD